MLERILQSSIRNRILVVVATLVLALVGAQSLWQLPVAVPGLEARRLVKRKSFANLTDALSG